MSGCANSWRMTLGGMVATCAPNLRRLHDMLRMAHGGDQHFGLELPDRLVNLADIGDQLHAVFADIVEPADERRHKRRARLGGENRLRRRKSTASH